MGGYRPSAQPDVNPLGVRSMKVWGNPKEGADESADRVATAVHMGLRPCGIPRGRRGSEEAHVLATMGL